MNKIGCYHAPATFAFCDRPLTLQLVVPDEECGLLELTLVALVDYEDGQCRQDTLRMLPVDGLTAPESHSVYAAVIAAEALAGAKRLTYHFCRAGAESETYTIPLFSAPVMPPFVVSEHFPWGGGPVQCMELYNPNDTAVDLYDYELIYLNDEDGVKGRNPMADAPDIHVLQPREVGVLNFAVSGVCKELEVHAEEENYALRYLAEQYPETCGDLSEREIRWMQVTLADKNEQGEWHTREGCFSIYHWLNPRRYRVVPRGGEAADAVYSMDVNPDKEHLSVRKFHSSRWTVDPRTPSVAVCTVGMEQPTPGYLHHDQFLPDPTDTAPPAILPLSPEGAIWLSKGDAVIGFAVSGKATAPRVWVKVNDAFVPFAAKENNEGVFEAVIPLALLARMPGRLDYYIEVSGGLYTAACGSAEAPRTVRIHDNAGPEILAVHPAEGQALIREQCPEIRVDYHDISGVSTETSVLCVDGRNISDAARWDGAHVTYTPAEPMDFGSHTLEITLRDLLGNQSYRRISFEIVDGSTMHCYRGEVHCHTLESDGMGTPAEALAYARDIGKADYFAVTDHSHYITREEMLTQKGIADAFNQNGAYATLHGFEMTWNFSTGYWGHLNVLNTDWITQYHENVNLPEMYERLKQDPDAIGMFNHPDDVWGDFDEFEGWDAEIDQKMCLAEIRGGYFDRGYTMMLSKGWHAAPVANEDNHSPNWTTATPSTGYILAPALTRENVLEAFRARRCYTTYDNTMKIYYRVNGEWMGSRLHAPDKLTAEIEVHTESENGIGLLSLVTEDNIVVARIDAGPLRDFSWQVELDPDFDYYYLRINNGSLYSATAPVFIEGRDRLNIKELSYGICAEDAAMPHVVDVTLRNDSERSMRDVRVDYYLTPLGGFELRALVPFASVELGELEAGKTHTVSRRFPAIGLHRRVTVVVNGWQGKRRYADTTYRLLTPIRINKVMPLTAPVTVGELEIANPFPYVELYNPAPVDIELKKYVIRLRHASGVQPLPERTLALDGYTVPAGKTLTIWVRPADCELTVGDFNARYGTELVEGEDILITTNRILSGSKVGGRRIELLCNKEMITRIGFGQYCVAESDVEEDAPLLYGDQRPMSWLQKKLELPAGERILPGVVSPVQIPLSKRAEDSDDPAKARTQEKPTNRVATKLTRFPLIPLQAARLIVTAVSAVKGLFSAKE